MKAFLTIYYARAAAVLMVVLLHASIVIRSENSPGFAPLSLGAAGIDLFFVTFGFLMWTSARFAPRTPAKFITRRIAKTAPFYWAVTIFSVLVAGNIAAPAHFINTELSRLAPSLMFLPNWSENALLAAPSLAIGWTVNLAAAICLIFGLLLPLRPHHRIIAICVVFGGIITARLTAGVYLHPALHFYGYSLIGSAALGMLMGWCVDHGALAIAPRQHSTKFSFVFLGAGAAGLACHGQLPDIRLIQFGLPMLSICFGLLLLEPAARRHPSRLLRFIGEASFAIFLTHAFSLSVITLVFSESVWSQIPLIVLALQTLFCSAVGCATHVFVERPLVRWSRQFFEHAHLRRALWKSWAAQLRAPRVNTPSIAVTQ